MHTELSTSRIFLLLQNTTAREYAPAERRAFRGKTEFYWRWRGTKGKIKSLYFLENCGGAQAQARTGRVYKGI